MISTKAHSTEKIKPQRLQPVRVKECLTCPRPTDTKMNRRDFERPQPIRILPLLLAEEEREKAKKSSVKKKILPERLGPCAYKFKSQSSRVHRHLNFNNIPVTTENNETNNVDQSVKPTLTNSKQTSKEIPEPKIRESFLVAPNFIKNKHLQGCVKTATKPSKLETLQENKSLDKKSVVPICSSKNVYKRLGENIVRHNNNNAAESQCKMKSNDCKTVKNKSLNIVNKNSVNCCKIPDAKPLEKETCALDKDRLKCQRAETFNEDECMKKICNNLQSTKIIVPENGLNAKHTSPEMLCIDRNEFIHLKCELENLVSTTEENLGKLKSTLTYVNTLLSIPQELVSQCSISKEREKNIKSMIDKEIQVETCCKLKQPTEEHSKFDDFQISKVITNDKENVDVRCTDSSPNKTDDSFLNLENQLDIKYTETVKKLSSMQNTPVIKKYGEKRPLREYLSLKSTMKFLQTPDHKLLYQKNNIDESNVVNKSYISNKVLTDLQNLYSDSPEFT